MIESAEVVVTSEDMAKAAVGSTLSEDHADLVCTRYAREQGHPIPQAAPEPRQREKGDPPGIGKIQDPAPDPLPGKVTYRLFYERKE